MPVQTSVITGTVAHKHSATGGSSDGGKLAVGGLGGDTSFDLSNGSIMYSNGTSLEELTIGGAGTSLTVSGGIPAWAAAASSSYVLVDSQTLGSDNQTLESTFSAINQSDISRLVCVLNGQGTVGGTTIRINGITTNTYNYDAWMVYGGSTGTSNYNAQNGFNHLLRTDVIGINIQCVTSITCNPVSENIQVSTQTSGEDGFATGSGYNTTASQTSIDAVRFYVNNSPGFKAGSRLDVYRINV